MLTDSGHMPARHSMWHWLWRQRWLPSALRKNAYKKLSAKGSPPSHPFEIDFFGLRYQGNLDNGIEFAMYHYGAFEKPLLFFLRDAMLALTSPVEAAERPGVFLDIGANIGQHSLFMSQFASTVHAFEPYESVANRLKHHLALNNLNNIALHSIGLGDSNDSLPFFEPAGSNKGVGSFDSTSQRRGNTLAGELTIRRGDDYFAETGISQIDLVKIDVEGFERRVLLGMQEALRQSRPVIVCEITYGQDQSFRSQEDLRRALPENYELLRFNTRKSNGKVARRRGARAKRDGSYKLVKAKGWRSKDQDDLIAVPQELMELIPMHSPGSGPGHVQE